MHLTCRNVNDAFENLVQLFAGRGSLRSDISLVRKSSRNGDVLMIEEPVTITYTHPKERVLFNQARDCNPFFHLYEAMWMLAGRNDVESLAYYNSGMKDYSDDGETLNGAYGYRWRNIGLYGDAGHLGKVEVDQLEIIIDHLRNNPNSRRAVLQMWNVEDDLLKIDSSKDVACNTSVYFSIRKALEPHPDARQENGVIKVPYTKYLDMTVCNRSNDLIWGMLGANVVHFSFLQEYMAAMIGVEVGKYNQISNNLHVYLEKFKPDEWLAEYNRTMHSLPKVEYEKLVLKPLVTMPKLFDSECDESVEMWGPKMMNGGGNYQNTFLPAVLGKAALAYSCHKNRKYDLALSFASKIQSDDWRIVCANWIKKRQKNWEKKNAV